MNLQQIADLVEQFGFPVVLSLGMGYFIFFVWKFVTQDLKPTLGNSHKELIRLLDQIRMLDNDLIRLRSKLNTVLEMQENEEKQHGVSDNTKDNNLSLDRRRPSSNREDGNTKK